MANPAASVENASGTLAAAFGHDDGGRTRADEIVAIAAALARRHVAGEVAGPFDAGTIRLFRPGDATIERSVTLEPLAPWTPPEVVAGGAWSTQGDVYALAVIAWRRLHDRWPADPASAELVRHRRLGEPLVTAPVDRHANLSAALRRGLDADPARRPSSARVFASVLADAAAADGAAEHRGVGALRAQLQQARPVARPAAAPPGAGLDLADHWRRWGRWAALAGTLLFGAFFLLGTVRAWGQEGWPCRGGRDCRDDLECSNNVCVDEGWVFAPPGEFRMGSATTEPERQENEGFRTVELTRGFVIRRRETTQESWGRVMDTTPAFFEACGSRCPIESVNWYEALEYVNRLSDQAGLTRCYVLEGCTGTLGGGCTTLASEFGDHGCRGDYVCDRVEFAGLDCRGYRLPTEAEFEYAARAGVQTTFVFGDWTAESEGSEILEDVARFARFSNNAQVSYDSGLACALLDEPHPADGQCGPADTSVGMGNRWRIQQLHGNVQEWLTDCPRPDTDSHTVDPVGGCRRGWAGVRGGAFFHGIDATRNAYRGLTAPADLRFIDLGFRPVRTIETGNLMRRVFRSMFGR